MKILTESLIQGIMHYQLKVLGGHVYEEGDAAQLMVTDQQSDRR
ncbi:hypothetical protein [Pseudomonas sp. PS01300]|nr:hypothetical protein [Pseudomonas sp. PS01300]